MQSPAVGQTHPENYFNSDVLIPFCRWD